MQLRSQQQEAFDAIKKFITDKDKSIFILKGYAGTGKTTMIKSIIPMLMTLGKIVHLMAPTGRAAKVLCEKTGYDACTIHRGIYAFENMQAVRYDDDGNLIETNHTKNKELRSKGSDDLQFWFAIRKHELAEDPSKNVYIIDESSMVSSMLARNESLHFGTDVLIDDLLTYARLHLGGKIIFVGDPAQLPPVGDNKSVALTDSFFEDKSLGVSSYELTEVLRQNGESSILKNAMMIRDLLGRVFKIALKSCAFFTYSIDALNHQIWRKVFIRPFLNVTVSSFLQSLFKIEINSSALICKIKAKRHHQNYRSNSCKFVIRHSVFHYSKK